MKKARRSSMLIVILILIFVVSACGGGNSTATNSPSGDPSESASPSPGTSAEADLSASALEPVTLTISTASAFVGLPGIQKNAVADVIKEKLAITMNIISSDPEKIKVMMAGGDLPDIMILPPTLGRTALDGKLAFPLKQLLASDGPNASKFMNALDVINTRLGNTDGDYYFLPTNVVKDAKEYINYSPWIGWFIRWDLYKEEGYPELKSYDDLIPLIASELKKHPKTDEGKKVYGLSGWTDWGLWPFYVPFIYAEGWTESTKNTVTKPDGTYVHRYAADGPLWRGLEFYNKAYRAGILDMDAFTQKYGDYVTKLQAGQLLSLHAGWELDGANAYFKAKGQDDKGMVAAVVDDATSQAYSKGSIVGDNDPWFMISKNSKHPERAMQFLDYFRSVEGQRLLFNGIQGVHWDIENGKPELKDSIIKEMTGDANFAKTTGVGLYNFGGIGGSTIVPEDGSYVDLRLSPKFIATKLTPLDKEYSEHYGGTFPGEAWDKLVQAGKAKKLSPFYNPALPALQPQSDADLDKIESNIEQILIKETTKAVLAKSDEEFKKEKDRIMGLINKAGFAQADAFWKQSYEKGLEIYNNLIAGAN